MSIVRLISMGILTQEAGQNGKNISLITYFHEEDRHQN
jgi:hypothetical protein